MTVEEGGHPTLMFRLTDADLRGSIQAADSTVRSNDGHQDPRRHERSKRMRNHFEDVLAQLRDAITKKSTRERDRGIAMELDGHKGAHDHIVRAAALEAVADAIQDVLDGDYEKAYAD